MNSKFENGKKRGKTAASSPKSKNSNPKCKKDSFDEPKRAKKDTLPDDLDFGDEFLYRDRDLFTDDSYYDDEYDDLY